jgi:hypothetical protein
MAQFVIQFLLMQVQGEGCMFRGPSAARFRPAAAPSAGVENTAIFASFFNTGPLTKVIHFSDSLYIPQVAYADASGLNTGPPSPPPSSQAAPSRRNHGLLRLPWLLCQEPLGDLRPEHHWSGRCVLSPFGSFSQTAHAGLRHACSVVARCMIILWPYAAFQGAVGPWKRQKTRGEGCAVLGEVPRPGCQLAHSPATLALPTTTAVLLIVGLIKTAPQ